MPLVNTITLPQDVLDRVERLLDFHRSTRLSNESVRREPHKIDAANRPDDFRVFDGLVAQPLPDGLADLPVATLRLMEEGLAALPPAQLGPAQDLKTLATWLHFADGIASKRRTVTGMHFVRTCASDGNCFPTELYVAALAIDGLEPGLYHYSPREFALRKLRDGAETLARLTRGRPDLIFLRTVPLAMFVSTIFCRSTWRFGRRGYRHALHDAGYLVQNLVTVGTGLGAQTMTRMILNDAATRDLIGVRADAEFGQAEAVQAMVAWVDHAHKPLDLADRSRSAVSPRADATSAPAAASPAAPMSPIARLPLANKVTSYVSILEAHQDCVAPGVAVREVRPPLTDMSPMPADVAVFQPPPAKEKPPGEALRKILLTRAATNKFSSRGITREQFLTIVRLAFRGGTFFPLHPDGPHVALVRPFWVIHDVVGFDAGVWYYNPPTDAWTLLTPGSFRRETAYLALEQSAFGQCAAVCFSHCHLHHLMAVAGPDIYRLAHLEAGIVTNRVALSTEALDLGWCETGSFYDDEVRQFLGLRITGWEPLSVLGIGHPLREADARHGNADAPAGGA